MNIEIKLEGMFDALPPCELERAACPAEIKKAGRRKQRKIERLAAKKLGLSAGAGAVRPRRVILAAALAGAVFAAGAVGVLATSGSRLWNGMISYFGPDSAAEELTAMQEGVLENNTSHRLEVLENTFSGLTIEYEGTVSAADSSRDGSTYSVFTVKRKNGKPFTDDEEHEWITAYSCYAPQINGGQPYRLFDDAAVRCNSDGSLSVTVEASVFPSVFGDHEVRLGFTGLYRVALHEDGSEDVLRARDELIQLTQEQFVASPLAVFAESTDIYPEWQGDMYKDDDSFAVEFEARKSAVLKDLESLSDGECYEGGLRCAINTEDISPTAAATAESDGMTAAATMFGLRVEIPEELYRRCRRSPDEEQTALPKAVVHLSDGSELTLECSGLETEGGSGHYLNYPSPVPLPVDSIDTIELGETVFKLG